MTTLLLAEHDNKALKDATAKALTAAKALGQPAHPKSFCPHSS
jgi:electron transfer flavoprotein alpha subunit